MSRPARKSANRSAKKRSYLRQATTPVAVDVDQVRQDLGKLLLSLEDLGVEALREVADRARALIAQKTQGEKQSLIGGVIDSAASIGNKITGLFTKAEAQPKKRGIRKARKA